MAFSKGKRGGRRTTVFVPWFLPSEIVVDASDVRRFMTLMKWARLEVTEDAVEELERFREGSLSKYSVTRLAVMVALTKALYEVLERGERVLAKEPRDPRVEQYVGGVEDAGSDWKAFVKEADLVKEVKDVSDDPRYDAWREMVEEAQRRGVVGRVVLETEDGVTVVVSFGAPTVMSPAYEEVADKEMRLVSNETNVDVDEVLEVLSVAFRVSRD